MSAPFPGIETTRYEDHLQPSRAFFVKAYPGTEDEAIRGFVPSFYSPHSEEELDQKVTVGGMPVLAEVDRQPFTIREVPLERRWAIRADGELMDATAFAQFHNLWYDGWYKQLKVEDPERQIRIPPYVNHPRPNVVKWVSVQIDPARQHQYVPMHYVADRTQGALPEMLEDADGNMVQRMDALLEAYGDPGARRQMRPSEIAEVEAHIQKGFQPKDPATGNLAELLREIDRLVDQKIAARDAEADPHLSLEVPPEAPADEFSSGARCGKEFLARSQAAADRNRNNHERFCKTCKAPPNSPPEAA